jgi:hypothetical protein
MTMSETGQVPGATPLGSGGPPVNAPPEDPTTKDVGKQEKEVHPLFTPKQVRGLAFAAFALLLLISACVLAAPTYLEHPTVRVTMCLLLSFCLAIFFFVFWPTEYELSKTSLLTLPLVRVTGPVALWVAVFAMLLYIMPVTGSYWGFFSPEKRGPPPNLPYHKGTRVQRVDGGAIEYQLVQNKNQPSYLEGIFVKFPPGENTIEAELKIPKYKNHKVTFKRTRSTFDVTGMVTEDEP